MHNFHFFYEKNGDDDLGKMAGNDFLMASIAPRIVFKLQLTPVTKKGGINFHTIEAQSLTYSAIDL